MTPQNIVSIKIKNFMGVSNIEIKPNQINQIVGENNQSKTSILKAIEFGWHGSTNGSLVKHGEDQAEVVFELPDETTIKRILSSAGKNTLSVKDKNDFKINSPQAYLDALIDNSAFNPLECLEPSKRTEAILKAIDLKVTSEIIANRIEEKIENLPNFNYSQHGLKVIDEAYNYYDKRRTEANRDALTKENKWKSYEADFKPVVPPNHDRLSIKAERENIQKRVVAAKVNLANIATMEKQNSEVAEKVDKYHNAITKIAQDQEEFNSATITDINLLEIKLVTMREKLISQNQAFNQRLEDGEKYLKDAEKEHKPIESKFEFESELRDCSNSENILNTADQEINAYEAVKTQESMIADLEQEWKIAQTYANNIERQAKLLQYKFKKELMENVEMPLEGLEYHDGVFLVNGIQIDNLSTSLTIKLAVNIARKLSKKSKLICIDGAEALVNDVYTQFLNEIKDDGFTYFLARAGVGNPDFPQITMKKGIVQ